MTSSRFPSGQDNFAVDLLTRKPAHFKKRVTKLSIPIHGPDPGSWLTRSHREIDDIVCLLVEQVTRDLSLFEDNFLRSCPFLNAMSIQFSRQNGCMEAENLMFRLKWAVKRSSKKRVQKLSFLSGRGFDSHMAGVLTHGVVHGASGCWRRRRLTER